MNTKTAYILLVSIFNLSFRGKIPRGGFLLNNAKIRQDCKDSNLTYSLKESAKQQLSYKV